MLFFSVNSESLKGELHVSPLDAGLDFNSIFRGFYTKKDPIIFKSSKGLVF